MAFMPACVSAPNMASSAAVEIYEAISPFSNQEVSKNRRVHLFNTAEARPKGPPRPRVCTKNHALTLTPGDKPNGALPSLPFSHCSLCGSESPHSFAVWQCKECRFMACPGCMPIGSAQEEGVCMYNAMVASIPDDIRLLNSWAPLQMLQRLAHTRTRSICESLGRYYLRFEVRNSGRGVHGCAHISCILGAPRHCGAHRGQRGPLRTRQPRQH